MRFPEFSGEWKESLLQDVATLSKGAGISKEQLSKEGNPCILYGELYTKYNSEVITEIYSRTNVDLKNLVLSKKNDVIIPSSGETAIDISTARCVPFDNIFLGGDLNIIRLNGHDGRFLSYQLNGVRRHDIAKVAQGVSVVHLYGENLRRLKVRYPSKEEQEKISDFMTVIDARIQTQIGAIEAIESLITGITSKISRSNNVKQVYLKDLLTERTERNVDHHEVYSVSVSEGVVNQVEYLGRSFAAADTSHYCVACYGNIIYTKSPTGSFPYGIVKRSDISEPVAVSPLYGVYRPLNDNIGIYLHQYFCSAINAHNYLHKLIQKGAKNTINITNQRFLQNTIPIPDEVTLEKYVRVIDALVQKLKNEKFLLESYRQQKVYLLKNMFV